MNIKVTKAGDKAELYVDSVSLAGDVGKILFLQKKLTKRDGSFRITRITVQLYGFLDSLAITKVMDIVAPH